MTSCRSRQDLLTRRDVEFICCRAMKQSILLLLWAIVIFDAGENGLRADEPTSGKVIVLDNDRTLEGDIELDGEQYRIRGAGWTTSIPIERVRKVCADKKEALTFLREKANREDPDERLKLARWCHLHGMRAEALEEVAAALEIRPGHAESKQLQHYFEQWARHEAESKNTPKPAVAAQVVTKPAPPPVSISADSMGVFVGRIQPILMNACARCHSSSENASGFHLERSYGIGFANRRAVQENLAAVLAQLHTSQPERSPLLVKSISAHGQTTDAPIKGRDVPAYRSLEDWVRLTLASNPHLQDVVKPPPTLIPEPPPRREARTQPELPAAQPAPVRKDVPVTTAPVLPEQARAVPVTTSPATTEAGPDAAPESEFDPSIFNRRMHPPRPKDRE